MPEVVGKSINSNTLINFFFEKIKRNEIFNLWTKARRSVIDIDDVTKILINLLSNTKHENKTINIANPEKYSSIHIVKIIENLTAKKAKYNLVNKGEDNWTIDVSQIIDSIENCKIKFNRNYLKYTLEKYFI